jgi:hypothetical protein
MAEGNDLSLEPRGPGIPDSSGQAIPPSRYFIKPGGSYVWIFILLDGHQFIEESQSYPGDFFEFSEKC